MTKPNPPFERVLIANRGEIAIRVIRACRDLGISPITVHSEADRDSLHVSLGDDSVEIGPASAAHSYLRPDAIVDAATTVGADAIHPGYGFLSEDPRLPWACHEAGIAFVGPPAAVMAQVGDKVLAKAAAIEAGLPVAPGSKGRVADVAEAASVSADIGYPVLLKASAGGGGRGIRLAETSDALESAFKLASVEAQAAFGDGGIFIEKRLVRPRHIEVQVLADAHGNVIHLFERDCSTQRRKQKLIEEAPAAGLDPAIRETLCTGAAAFARRVGYVGAGTCEFLVAEDGTTAFIEMNARIQVEHGITELLTGVDLVVEQLRIAAGLPLDMQQEDVRCNGAAMQFRVNAEDPQRGFMPSPGTIASWRVPGGPGVRVDTGFEAGRTVQPYYDSLLAKLLVWGGDRHQALARARRALAEFEVAGVATTLGLHHQLLDWDALLQARVHTEALEAHLEQIRTSAGRSEGVAS